jgi:hypothetical protein
MNYFNTVKFFALLFTSFFTFITTCYAENQIQTVMAPVSSLISNIQKTIAEVKAKTAIPVLFPTTIPVNSKQKKYFASSDLSQANQGNSYTINIDSTKDCHGIHYCNLGYVSAKKDANWQLYSDMANKNITVPITLAHHIKGYFTPGHAMGDYFPANIQWKENDVLYTISWDTTDTVILNMANSAIKQGPN